MVIVDYSAVALSSLFAMMSKQSEVNEDFLRHIILNSIRSIRNKTRSYGELILAIDTKRSWRKNVFPYYKANRAKAREESGLDWNTIFQYIHTVKEEIKEHFPYKVIEVDGAEADDIIATLAFKNEIFPISNNTDYTVIVAEDKDFIQLQKIINVKQWAPIREKWIEGNGEAYLFEHILKGDTGDGVPNFLSSDSCLVEKIRQKPVMSKKIEEWKKLSEKEFSDVLTKLNAVSYYNRNKTMIDLTQIPKELQINIIDAYNKAESNKSSIMKYFQDKKLKILLDYINEF